MRKILFRGKRIDNGEWVYGDLIHRKVWKSNVCIIRVEDDGFDNYIEYEVTPETIGQYIGLTDKSGKRIFEGDIITQVNNCDNLKMTGVVIFNKAAQFAIRHTYTKDENIYKSGKTKSFAIRSNCKIIGNIYDNPELMR